MLFAQHTPCLTIQPFRCSVEFFFFLICPMLAAFGGEGVPLSSFLSWAEPDVTRVSRVGSAPRGGQRPQEVSSPSEPSLGRRQESSGVFWCLTLQSHSCEILDTSFLLNLISSIPQTQRHAPTDGHHIPVRSWRFSNQHLHIIPSRDCTEHVTHDPVEINAGHLKACVAELVQFHVVQSDQKAKRIRNKLAIARWNLCVVAVALRECVTITVIVNLDVRTMVSPTL